MSDDRAKTFSRLRASKGLFSRVSRGHVPAQRACVPGYPAVLVAEKTVETRESEDTRNESTRAAAPGLVLVFSMGKPTLVPLRLDGEAVVGRGSFAGALELDDRVSRTHVRVSHSLSVEDLGSRNGTVVNGERVKTRAMQPGDVLRIGHTLILAVRDVTPFETPRQVDIDDAIVGPTMRPAWDVVVSAGQSEGSVLLLGESGSGKEVAARAFHRATGRAGSLVAVNCAAIPAGLAERLLFGTRKGAYSGADADADGYVQSANNGTLFLDEIAELDAQVQAKLLRVLETKEVFALGASKPKTVDIRICSATHKDLRGQVSRGAFRQDLYYRIGRPEVRLPPLRERKEEIAWLVEKVVAESGLVTHVSLVEACMLRTWPGNIRELLAEAKRAAAAAKAAGSKEAQQKHLADTAGRALDDAIPSPKQPRKGAAPDDETIRKALEAASGNVTKAARDLGMHRTQLRRWIAKNKDTTAREPE
jgi:transcriptional regulator of acetoin/glycerol metabolism